VSSSPALRKLTLTAHVVSSVGWLGAVAAFLALAIASSASSDAQTVRSAASAMELTGWFVLVPLAIASLVTGLFQSLTTTWGLFRHYWVVAKLVINLFASVILLMYMETLGILGDLASRSRLSSADLETLRSPSPVLHSTAALGLLIAATTLAVYKPRGLTRYGRRKRREELTGNVRPTDAGRTH
jgi:hypothetical protein